MGAAKLRQCGSIPNHQSEGSFRSAMVFTRLTTHSCGRAKVEVRVGSRWRDMSQIRCDLF